MYSSGEPYAARVMGYKILIFIFPGEFGITFKKTISAKFHKIML